MEKLIFEKGRKGRQGVVPPDNGLQKKDISSFVPREFLRAKPIGLPELSELEVVRHYTNLARLNYSVDSNFYPLGSCTMKYNPRINETLSQNPQFCLHPLQPWEHIQGVLEIMFNLEKLLCRITGMGRFTFQPSAGAHGELTGMLIVRAYHNQKGRVKDTVIVPDSAHGTNPASAAMAGYKVVEIKSKNGLVDLEELHKHLNEKTAAVMLTNPNTLGLFEKDILKIADLVHKQGALLYYDGANLNALLGVVRPGDLGFDLMHINLHKTFSTPHGGGGPGSGPVGVKKELARFLPVPVVAEKNGKFVLNYDLPFSIGKVRSFYGNVQVIIKAYLYILSLGKEHIKDVALYSVLNANYIKEKLKDFFDVPYGKRCMHEVVFSAKKQKEKGVLALDIAKRLIDFGIHPPTIYFPLIVKEALMVEPTETESKETLDYFIQAMQKIAQEAENSPDKFHNCPKTTPVSRLDEVKAARQLDLKWQP